MDSVNSPPVVDSVSPADLEDGIAEASLTIVPKTVPVADRKLILVIDRGLDSLPVSELSKLEITFEFRSQVQDFRVKEVWDGLPYYLELEPVDAPLYTALLEDPNSTTMVPEIIFSHQCGEMFTKPNSRCHRELLD
ncbi:MAG: hypothetical protein PHW53_02530 [Patescibacteria group bacterium]|nr:hypothetical protein [Patescibacteria group bacterium]